MTQLILGSQNVQIGRIQNSTVTVSIDAGPRRAVPLEPASFELPASVTSPARLLRARYGVVPYLQLGDLVDRLIGWAHGREPFAMHVVAGGAGMGKTRVAIELCRALAELGWLTGLLKTRVDSGELTMLADAPTARLVVVDYAETRQEQLAELLPVLAGRATGEQPVRVLLTIRSRTENAESVRRLLYGRSDALDIAVDEAMVELLSELPFGDMEQSDLFTTAVEAIACRLGQDATVARGLLPHRRRETPTNALTLLAAAYLAVVDGKVPSSRTNLMEGLLSHEDRYWSATAPAGYRDERAVALRRRVIALATLAGASAGGSEAETSAAQLLRLVPDLADASELTRRVLARWAHDLYPGAAWWNPVEPDLIGEHLVATTYGDQPEVLTAVLSERLPDALVQPLRLLARAARDHPPLAGTLYRVVDERIADLCRVAVAQASGVDAPQLFQAGTTVAAALEPLVALVPPDPNQVPKTLDGFPQFNTVLSQLAMTLTSQLTEYYRQRAAADPATFTPDLAHALNDLGNRLSNVGRREQALVATAEAVEIYRRLTAADPAAFEPDLAMALSNGGNRLADMGRREQALQATEEAVDIYRRLANANPAAFEPDLAGVLNNLGGHLSNLGRREQALLATVEAVEIRRRLATANPAAFEPDLARALRALAGIN